MTSACDVGLDHSVPRMMATKGCDQCGSEKPREWSCLDCNVCLHDFCIDKHIAANAQGTHSVIPSFDTSFDLFPSKKTPPRADKVLVTGLGPRGVVGETSFVVETLGAGHGELSVSIRGHKGVFGVKMVPRRERSSIIDCYFTANEVGEYIIDVTWSGVRVQKSPFSILIGETIDT